jgi:hypothetical protein
MILFGEGSLRKAIREFVVHYHHDERNHQGLGNRLIIEEESGVGRAWTDPVPPAAGRNAELLLSGSNQAPIIDSSYNAGTDCAWLFSEVLRRQRTRDRQPTADPRGDLCRAFLTQTFSSLEFLDATRSVGPDRFAWSQEKDVTRKEFSNVQPETSK